MTKNLSNDMSDVELFWKIRRARCEGDVETLIAALDNDIEASQAADYLGDIGAVSAVPALISLLEAADPLHRAAAALALGKLNASGVCPRMMEIAEKDQVPWVRSCAITALGSLACDVGQLFICALDNPDLRVRGAAVAVLVDAGQSDAIPALLAARKRGHWFERRAYSKAIRRIRRRARQQNDR